MKYLRRFNESNEMPDFDKMTSSEIRRYLMNNFEATVSNIEKLVDMTKDLETSQMTSISYSLGVTAGGLYCLKMKEKYGKHVPI
jgi:hypothetical protein